MKQTFQILFEKTQVHLDETDALAEEILKLFPHRIYLMKGEMGAGKTTWVQAFCRVLGTVERAKSPTFSLVNEYNSQKGSVYHFDLYRLSGETEAAAIGLEEYWDSGNYCFIEWPDIAGDLIPAGGLVFEIQTTGQDTRSIRIYNASQSLTS